MNIQCVGGAEAALQAHNLEVGGASPSHATNSAKLRLARLRAKRGGAAAHNRLWNTANREKYLAHKAVEYAIKSGKLNRQPCERCGTSEKVQAHHEDYSKRLEVNWLCPLHHKQRHAELALSSTEQGLPRLSGGAEASAFFKTVTHTNYP